MSEQGSSWFTYDSDLSLWVLPCWYCETIVTSYCDGLPLGPTKTVVAAVSVHFLHSIVMQTPAQPRVALLQVHHLGYMRLLLKRCKALPSMMIFGCGGLLGGGGFLGTNKTQPNPISKQRAETQSGARAVPMELLGALASIASIAGSSSATGILFSCSWWGKHC